MPITSLAVIPAALSSSRAAVTLEATGGRYTYTAGSVLLVRVERTSPELIAASSYSQSAPFRTGELAGAFPPPPPPPPGAPAPPPGAPPPGAPAPPPPSAAQAPWLGKSYATSY